MFHVTLHVYYIVSNFVTCRCKVCKFDVYNWATVVFCSCSKMLGGWNCSISNIKTQLPLTVVFELLNICCFKMGFKKILSTQPSNKTKHERKRHHRSRSPKRSKGVKTRRNSMVSDISCRYPLENKIRHSSRHASPLISHHHRKHKKGSPANRKVWKSNFKCQ